MARDGHPFIRLPGVPMLPLASIRTFATAVLLALVAAPAHAADPKMSIGDVTITEGDSGARIAVFTVSLSSPATAPVSFDVATAEGNAVGNDDFQHYYSWGRSISAGQ